VVRDRTYRSHAKAPLAIFEWIEVWYRRKRFHG
jgi:hypothetical protein